MNSFAYASLPPSIRRAVRIREREENRPEWIANAGERIEGDADKVRELVTDNLGVADDPGWADEQVSADAGL